jgi:hypothetical protein
VKIYQAAYEDQEQTAAEAKRRGWDGVSGGMLDYISDNGVRISQSFKSREEALAWLLAEINAGKSVFGCGDIDVLEQPKRRCRYCSCGGWLTIQSFSVDDTGIVEEREVSEECYDGED